MKKILCLMIALFFTACENKQNTEITSLKEGEIVTLKGVEGGERKLKKIKGGFELVGNERKIIMFDIFGTFCPPCQKEANNLTNLQIELSDKLAIIGLIYLDDATDDYVKNNFSDRFNAHYFISNSKTNERIIKSISEDIAYPRAIQLPFKVVLKNGIYQTLTDIWENKNDTKFYLGDVGIETMKSDILRLLK